MERAGVWAWAVMRKALVVVGVLLGAATGGGCGALSVAGPRHAPGSGDPIVEQELAAGFGLAAPSELAKHASYTYSDRMMDGSLYTDAGGGGDDRVVISSTYAKFMPQWVKGVTDSIGDAARAYYDFTLPGYSNDPTIECEWQNYISPSTWIGLSNWAKDRWDWYPAPTGDVLDVGSLAPYIKPSAPAGRILVAFVVLGTEETILKWVRIGPPLWVLETADPGPDAGSYTSLALGPGDVPEIGYQSGIINQEILRMACKPSGSWEVGTADATPGTGAFASLKLDSVGQPHIAYYDDTNAKVMHAWHDGSSWHTDVVTTVAGAVYMSLAIDSVNRPRIAFCKDTLCYASFDGVSWSVLPIALGSYSCCSLALDSADEPHIAYYDKTNKDLIYAYYETPAWHFYAVDSVGDVGWNAALALDSADHAHICYAGIFSPDLPVKYAYTDGVSWFLNTVEVCDWYLPEISLALDASGNAHVAFNHTALGLRYAYYSGSVWVAETVEPPGDPATMFRYASIALDSTGKPHVSYCDLLDSALQYASRTE